MAGIVLGKMSHDPGQYEPRVAHDPYRRCPPKRGRDVEAVPADPGSVDIEVNADRRPGLGSDLVHLPGALRVGNKFFDSVTHAGLDLLRSRGTDTQNPARKTAAACNGCLLVTSYSDEGDA